MFGARIRKRRKELGFSQEKLAVIVGVTKTAVSDWEREQTSPKGKNLLRLAKALQSSATELLEGDETAIKENPGSYHAQRKPTDTLNIPVYDAELAAGDGFEPNGDHVEFYFALPTSHLIDSNLPTDGVIFAKARGDSMASKINDGDLVLINTHAKTPIDGEIFAFVDDGQLRIKRFVKQIGGTWALRSDNPDPAYRDEIVSPQDVGRIHIVGQAVGRFGGF